MRHALILVRNLASLLLGTAACDMQVDAIGSYKEGRKIYITLGSQLG